MAAPDKRLTNADISSFEFYSENTAAAISRRL